MVVFFGVMNNTDPKKDLGLQKTPLQLLPPEAMRASAVVLGLGAKKYGEWNWRQTQGVETMTYVGAIRRHLDAVVDGEDLDPESGESHIAHIVASGMILLDAKFHNKLIDNRPPTSHATIPTEKLKEKPIPKALVKTHDFIRKEVQY